jgi:hypothetical protein
MTKTPMILAKISKKSLTFELFNLEVTCRIVWPHMSDVKVVIKG